MDRDSKVINDLLNAEAGGRILSLTMDEYVKDCFNGDKPPCRCACPVDLDVSTFVSRVQRGSFNRAYTMYRDAVVFPGIICRICEQPCLSACVREKIDDSINIRKLEKAVVDYASSTAPTKYRIPKKKEKIAVIGAGLCGLTATLKLSSQGYNVTLFEKEDKVGGRLRELLSPEIFAAEIENQMQHLEYELELNNSITGIEELKAEYNAILIATGQNGNDFGFREGLNRDSLGTVEEGVFLAGSLLGTSPLESIENGVRVAKSIDNFLKIKRMHVMQGIDLDRSSRLQVNLEGVERIEGIKTENYTKEEAVQEAERCLRCDCVECQKVCELMQSFKKLPKKIVSDVRVTLNAVDQLSPRVATRLISSCNICGGCGNACPVDIDMGEFLLNARRIMHREGALPPVFHDFWIRDLRFTESERAYLARNAPGYESSKYVFFPGCQLGASDPAYVEKSYEYLLEKCPETGLILGCCGVPAEWAGDELLTKETIDRIRVTWESMGKPVMILACPTCEKMFSKYLPEIEKITIYDFIDEKGLPLEKVDYISGSKVSIFDPCTSRYSPDLQKSIRNLVEKAGLQNIELPSAGKKAQCCGYGGHIYSANPSLAQNIASRRVALGEHPYITYCTNCRDIFADTGKPCRHILDVLFNLNDDRRHPPSLTERRVNRIRLRANLLESVWQEEGQPVVFEKPEIIISPELTEKLNKQLIIEDDIRETIKYCESTGNKIYNPEKGYYIGHLRQGLLTYWVFYKIEGEAYRLINAYSHRLKIEGE
ncbi:MAG: pyridine nucleotide-disulfide oxidoreductase/dicluster-binding protein [Desulfitobacteriia bacterium]